MRPASPPRMALTLCLSLLAVLLGLGAARAQEVTGAEIIEFGIYERGQIVGEFAPPNRGYRRQLVADMTHLETATIIPGRLGITFGIRYRVIGNGFGFPVPVKVVIRFPQQGLLSPEDPEPMLSDEYEKLEILGSDSFSAHTFDKQWEIEPGIWRIEIWSGDEKLAEKEFEVVTPPIS